MADPRLPLAPGQPIVERTMGCYNCTHSSTEAAKKFWEIRRLSDLEVAKQQAAADPMGERAPQVMRLKHMINETDKAVAAGLLCRCRVEGSPADLISLGFLCDKWTAAQGASVARDGAPVDKLPGELMEEVANGSLKRRTIK